MKKRAMRKSSEKWANAYDNERKFVEAEYEALFAENDMMHIRLII